MMASGRRLHHGGLEANPPLARPGRGAVACLDRSGLVIQAV